MEVLCEINQEIWKIGINSFPGSNSSDVSFYLSMVEITANVFTALNYADKKH